MDDFANPELALHPENLAHNARVLSNIRAGWLGKCLLPVWNLT
jgi:hypothetical protein